MSKIGFSKLGTKIYFDKTKWGHLGGFEESVNLIKILAKNNEVFLMSNSDIDVYKKSETYKGELDHIQNFYKKDPPKINKLIVLNGILGQYNCIKKNTSNNVLSVLKNYTWPTIDYINKSDTPWIYLYTDSRYNINKVKDLERQPEVILSQFEDVENKIRYAYLEEAWLYGKQPKEFELKTHLDSSNIDFYFNSKGNRDKHIKKFIKESKNKINVYRSMGTEVKERHLPTFYKGTKYTLNIGLDSKWITQKWNKFAHHGVIQFAFNYDDQNLKYNSDDFLRVSSPQEMDEKIDQIESSPKLYELLLRQNFIPEDAYKGTRIRNILNYYLQ